LRIIAVDHNCDKTNKILNIGGILSLYRATYRKRSPCLHN
jgi:hypothetical protein